MPLPTKAEMVPPIAVGPKSAPAPKANVLLVDDRSENLLALEAVLSELEVNLARAHSGEEALRRLADEEFALVLLDVQMPGLDGFETAKLIRSQPKTESTPIIFLTAYEIDLPQLERGYSLGAVDFLVKPLSPIVLRAKVAGLVEFFHAKRKIKGQAEQYRLLIDSTTVYAIFMLDPEGYIVTWNAGAERIKGYRAEEIIGQHFSRFYPQDALERDFPDYELKVAGSEGRFEDEGWRLRKDGSRFWANVVITALRDETGALRGFSKVTRDLTERKQAEQALRRSEERFRLLVERVEDYAIFMLDPEGRIATWNAGAERIKGYRAEEITGQHFSRFYPQEAIERGFPEYELKVAASQGRFEDEGWRLRKDGSRFWASVVITALHDEAGILRGFSKITRDLTEKKQAEERARRLLQEEAARQAAEANDRRKDEFLAMLAHELRNPLAPIRNSLQILKMPRIDAETLRQLREVMERQVHQLVRLVDDLLDVSRVMRGKIELRKETVELASIVGRAVETAQPLIDAHEHELELNLPAESLLLSVDPVRLAQVIANLLANAAKYMEPRGRIWLTAQREDDEVLLRVRDSGIGIAPEVLPYVFDLFVQADHGAARAQGGLGIGLTLVKNLVRMHKGSVEAHSGGLGEGSEFTVRLPLSELICQGRRPQDSGQGQQPASPRGHRLLIVDDNHDAADTLAVLLRLQGHEVRVARDGPAALEIVQDYRPALMFLDLGMPGMDGYEVARRIRQQSGMEHVLMAALTGWGQTEDRCRTAEAGFDYHLVKPPEPQVLESLLAGLNQRNR